jgi:hypothetical protein
MDKFSQVLFKTIEVQLQLVDELIKFLEERLRKLDIDQIQKEIMMEKLYERRLEKETSW